MSTLRQSLQEHRAADTAASCVTAEERQSALIVSSWQGDSWVLPWAHFISARLTDGASRLDVTFTPCKVLVTGERLAGLVEDLAAFRIGWLRDFPVSYRKNATEGEPFISRIEIHATEEGKAKTTREPS